MSTVQPRDSDHRYWMEINTRWMDLDSYGHVNNAQYYSFFDTAVTTWLIEHGGLRPGTSDVIGLCIDSHCHFEAPLSFPETVTGGVRVAHVGSSSVRYEVVLYKAHADEPVARGHFVHVYVDRITRRPVPVPKPLREAIEEQLA